MFGKGIGLGINRHTFHTHAAQRADDATSNSAAICDKDFLEHLSPGAGRPAFAVHRGSSRDEVDILKM
jgi:hypothetical protein